MKKIAFIGGFDKLDIIHYIAIVFFNIGKKTLIIDTTRMQKSRFITAAMDNSKTKYITTSQGIDIAVGFSSFQEIQEEIPSLEDDYDYIFLDTDSYKKFQTFNFSNKDLIFLVSSFDLYSLRVGVNVLSQFKDNEIVNKVLFAKTITPYHLQYIHHLCKNCNFKWGEIDIFFPYDNGDLTVIHENQREYKMALNKFSKDFLGSLLDLCVVVAPENAKAIRKFIKNQSKV